MAFPVTKSELPVVFDTLPALKVRWYRGQSKTGNVYCTARVYFLQNSLQLSLCAFEREPDAASRVEFALGTSADAFLLVSLAREVAALTRCGAGGRVPLAAPVPTYFGGVDEQGWYWGANLALEPPLLEKAGLTRPEDGFSAALFKSRTDEEAYGASFPMRGTADKLCFADFGRFAAVTY